MTILFTEERTLSLMGPRRDLAFLWLLLHSDTACAVTLGENDYAFIQCNIYVSDYI